MAGIAGWIARAGAAGPDESRLSAMLQAIGHRGSEGLCGIVDRNRGRELVMAAGARDDASRVAVVLDGTIANARELSAELRRRGHRFDSASDSEVLLRAYLQWDKEVAKGLSGQFAFAIWDARKERLMLARDRFGEKPLYLYEKGGVMAFASETTALKKAFALEANPEAVQAYAASGCGSESGTLYRGVRKLGPATQALWHFGRLIETRYWAAPDREPFTGQPVSGGVEAFAVELEDAVRRRPADAVFLSGGLDSAALVALASRNNAQLQTYSFGLAEDRNSELSAAAEVAKQFGTAHHEVVASPQELSATLRQVIVIRDAPAARPSDVAVHHLAKSARGARRILTGEGCDEVLGGYRRYITARLKGNFRHDLSAAQARLSDDVLERTERLGAGAGVEAHQPFLDHGLAETVSALPDDLRVRGLATKWLLREAARDLLPRIGPRRRGGFRVRASDVMSKELLQEHLTSPTAWIRNFLEDSDLDRMLKEYVDGKKTHEPPLWTLLNLEIWHHSCASG